MDLSLSGSDALYPQVAVSQDGSRATAVWYRGIMTGTVQSASATVSGSNATWSGPVDLSAAGTPLDPTVDVSADGSRAAAVWRRYDGSTYAAESAAATVTGSSASWGSPVTLATVGYSPQVVLSADGTTATAVWQGSDGTTLTAASASALVSGTSLSWGATARLSDASSGASSPQLASSGTGARVTAVWAQSDGEHNLVRASSARVTGNTADSGPSAPLSAAGQPAGLPQVALSDAGHRATAVWYRWRTTVRSRRVRSLHPPDPASSSLLSVT